MTIQFDEDKSKKRLSDLRHSEEEGLVKMLAEKYDLGYIDLGPTSISPDALKLVDEKVAREAQIAPFSMIGKRVRLALRDPENPKAQEAIADLQKHGYKLALFFVSNASLEKAWGRYKDISFALQTKAGSLDISNTEIVDLVHRIKNMADVRQFIQETLDDKKSSRISRILEIMVAGAIATDASDIHIEPAESDVRLRYRLDGVLIDVLKFDRDTYALLRSRIKLISGLKLNIKDNAQDGRFSVLINGVEMEIRTSVLPGAYGESIVTRILNPETIRVSIESLGMEPTLFDIMKREIDRPNGMILTTGPTGSGKTTTLYAFLSKIYVPEIKIITIEDPIEYHLGGIVQTQTNSEKGYTFASGLRAVLRQDPDVIMVGEIRDNETAEMAINSALTGHLVFSTLHTNNAAGTYPRLIDLGVNSGVLTSAINVSIAQRLVRILCPHCKKEVKLEGADKEKLQKVVDSIVVEKYRLPTTSMWLPGQCEECNHTGYKGRVGVFEAILTDAALEKVLRENPSEREIRSATRQQGILDMRQDGVVKVLQGVTSLEELVRVIDLQEI